MTFTIPFRLPSLNEYTKAINKSWRAGNDFKQDIEQSIALFIRMGIKTMIDYPVKITFHWYEPNEKRDMDNVAFAKKFILDAMQKTGKLKNDNRKYVKGFKDEFYYEKTAKVVVEIVRVEI